VQEYNYQTVNQLNKSRQKTPRLAGKIERANKKLFDDLTKKFREENPKLREELSNIMKSEMMKVS
jgi:hypothetical protein